MEGEKIFILGELKKGKHYAHYLIDESPDGLCLIYMGIVRGCGLRKKIVEFSDHEQMYKVFGSEPSLWIFIEAEPPSDFVGGAFIEQR